MSYQYAMPSRSYSYPQAPPGFPQLPFKGPPPKPPHIRVNPQDWQNGSWAINPAFNSSKWSLSSSQSSQSWVPSQAWHQQRAQEWQVQQQQMAAAAAYNPYKRVPRPPSAEYLATKLSDNPLGLSNMVPREELFGPSDDEGIAAPTPWVWNPRGLDPDDNEEGTSTNTRRTGPPPPASAPPQGRHPANLLYGRQSQAREMTDPTPQSQQRRNTAPTRHSSEPPADRRTPVDAVSPMERPLDRPRQYQRDGAPYPPETFTSSRELQPTFSSNIVRTPHHYKTRSSSTGPSQSIYGPPTSHGSIDSQLADRFEQLSTQSNPLSRQSSLPTPLGAQPTSSSMTGAASFVDEPSSMLSPLVGIGSSNHKHSSRPLGRHSSVPVVGPSSSLSAIPEAPSDPTRRSPHHHHHSRHTSPPALGLVHRPALTPPRLNPLPEPPQELGRNPGIAPPVQRTPPAQYRVAVRKGLWNRRGDHLTMDGFVVYAPVDRAYPEELRDYPAEAVGYRDHLGSEVGYLATRPELPESLPRFGQPPRQPYEQFVVYEYMQ
ncbi:hypothetical protein B0H17DRAFT_1087231 [Mycena rosella]|uniref:Uncharacterized protein n=1 Tax=Mycena rosella TaxID=1033263 RepID=A0AAD7CXV1_MYCRO|nr:hypothetical protein B0H17DRAFT_1087231 [Mycena rosella]